MINQDYTNKLNRVFLDVSNAIDKSYIPSAVLGFIDIRKNKIKTRVVSCPTIRGINGIALSSRNEKLKKNHIKTAGKIYKYLKSMKKKKNSLISKKQKINAINKIILLGAKKIDYLECININTLKSIKTTDENYNIFIAYYLGKVRLIDNL